MRTLGSIERRVRRLEEGHGKQRTYRPDLSGVALRQAMLGVLVKWRRSPDTPADIRQRIERHIESHARSNAVEARPA